MSRKNQSGQSCGKVSALLLCSERSGSNLLRCLLDAHPRVFAPNTMALGLLCADYDRHAAKYYPDTWKSILREVSRRINESTFYTGVSIEENELAQNVAENDAGSLYSYAYYKGMSFRGADQVIIKEHQAWRIAAFFLRRFPQSKIIVQVRDPRDHAVSCKKLAGLYASYHGSVPRATRIWRRDQYEALQLRDRSGTNTVRIHRYQDLVVRPRDTLQGLCEFLNIDWEESMLDYYLAQAEQRRQSDTYLHNMWANLDRPIISSSLGQWKKSLKPHELRVVEREVGSLLSAFGYAVSNTLDESNVSKLMSAMYRLCAAIRYYVVTIIIWLAWVLVTRDHHVPLDVVLGNAVRAHLPYERFRDRLGYRL